MPWTVHFIESVINYQTERIPATSLITLCQQTTIHLLISVTKNHAINLNCCRWKFWIQTNVSQIQVKWTRCETRLYLSNPKNTSFLSKVNFASYPDLFCTNCVNRRTTKAKLPLQDSQWRIQDFPGGAILDGALTCYLIYILPKNCVEPNLYTTVCIVLTRKVLWNGYFIPKWSQNAFRQWQIYFSLITTLKTIQRRLCRH